MKKVRRKRRPAGDEDLPGPDEGGEAPPARPAGRPPLVTPIARAVDRHYAKRLFGDPDGSFVLRTGDDPPPYACPLAIEIPHWTYAERALTRVGTLGMAEVPLADGSRIELHMAVARRLGDDERTALGLFLSSLAAYPFQYGTPLARDDFLTRTGEIPAFPGFAGILIDDLDVPPEDRVVDVPSGEKVALLLAVPVTEDEVDLLRARGREGAERVRERWKERGEDRLDPGRAR